MQFGSLISRRKIEKSMMTLHTKNNYITISINYDIIVYHIKKFKKHNLLGKGSKKNMENSIKGPEIRPFFENFLKKSVFSNPGSM